MKMATRKIARRTVAAKKTPKFSLPLRTSKLCPVELLRLDTENPRLQTGLDVAISSEQELIEVLADIAALDELIASICSNTYLNLEPMIVLGPAHGPFRVLEGNRRLAAIKLLRDPSLAKSAGVRTPNRIPAAVLASTEKVLCFRVNAEEEARAFIGFKHINGPQRWDAYAKARYVTEWYKSAKGQLSVSDIAARMGDTNDTLRSYIYSILILEQAEATQTWSIRDRSNPGRFAFSHFYTALSRKEYQEFLGIQSTWSDKPPLRPIAPRSLPNLGQALSYIYGARSEDQPALVKSQNPDLKDLGYALVNERARAVLEAKGTLDEARDTLKTPNAAFGDTMVSANLRLKRAIDLISLYDGKDKAINAVIEEALERADLIATMTKKKKGFQNAA